MIWMCDILMNILWLVFLLMGVSVCGFVILVGLCVLLLWLVCGFLYCLFSIFGSERLIVMVFICLV